MTAALPPLRDILHSLLSAVDGGSPDASRLMVSELEGVLLTAILCTAQHNYRSVLDRPVSEAGVWAGPSCRGLYRSALERAAHDRCLGGSDGHQRPQHLSCVQSIARLFAVPLRKRRAAAARARKACPSQGQYRHGDGHRSCLRLRECQPLQHGFLGSIRRNAVRRSATRQRHFRRLKAQHAAARCLSGRCKSLLLPISRAASMRCGFSDRYTL